MSARSSEAGMPVRASTSNTREAGTRDHLDTAVRCRPSFPARTVEPPAARIANDRGGSERSMAATVEELSTASKALFTFASRGHLYFQGRANAPSSSGMNTMTPDRYRKFVGENLKLARVALGMSQAEMAARYELGDKSRLSHWERGVHEPDIWFIFRLFRDQRVDPNWIYLGDKAALPHSLAVHLDAADTALPSAVGA